MRKASSSPSSVPSGCGKTTFLRVVAALEQPTAGEVSVNGMNPDEARRARAYGYVFQAAGLYPWRTIGGNIALPLENMGFSKLERARRAREVLELVELGGFEKKYPWQLSGGMQQRASIARALAFDADILLMDEPADPAPSRLHLDHDLQRIRAGARRGHLRGGTRRLQYEDMGVATLEDGMWVLEENLEDPEFVDEMTRFVRASMKGWRWAEESPKEAAQIVLNYDETGAQTEAHQVRIMGEIAKLTEGSDGSLDEAAYQRAIDTLLACGSDPVISATPEGAFTHEITDAALQ